MKLGNLEVYGVIYKITNNINGKVYIGQTTRGFDKRYKFKGNLPIEKVHNQYEYLKNIKHKSFNSHLFNSIEKYGFEAFEIAKIFDVAFSKEELDIKEQYWIKKYNSYRGGYNRNEGGCGNPGYKHTKEEIKKITYNSTGANNPMFGKRHSKETKEKISENRKVTKFTREKISEKLYERIKNGNYARKQEVFIYDTDLKLLFKSNTVIEASKWLMDNGYINTINNGRSIINRCSKNNKIYKGLYLSKISKE